MSDKLVLMRTHSRSNRPTIEKVAEYGGQDQRPLKKMGYYVGTCKTYTRKGHKVMNKQLHQAGYIRHHAGPNAAMWTNGDGSIFDSTWGGGEYTWTRSN